MFKLSLLLTLSILWSQASSAQKFDDFLVSLQQKLPMKTERMRNIVNTYRTKLAHPSWLERKGIINVDAAAAYNGFLNTLVLKPNMTTSMQESNSKGQRLKSWPEIRKDEPTSWHVQMGIIFHELSHAEFSWMQDSKDAADQELVQLLNKGFRDYIEKNHPSYNFLDRT